MANFAPCEISPRRGFPPQVGGENGNRCRFEACRHPQAGKLFSVNNLELTDAGNVARCNILPAVHSARRREVGSSKREMVSHLDKVHPQADPKKTLSSILTEAIPHSQGLHPLPVGEPQRPARIDDTPQAESEQLFTFSTSKTPLLSSCNTVATKSLIRAYWRTLPSLQIWPKANKRP